MRSEAGGGTKFLIYLPEVVPSSDPIREPFPDMPLTGSGRILLVEDDSVVRDLLNTLLSRGGYDVVEASSGEEAVAIFRQPGAPFDLLVSDVVLPGMNGRELYDHLEAHRPGLPVLFVSGYSHDVLSKSGLPPRAHLIMKPFRRRELMAKIREVLHTDVPHAPY